MASNLITSVPQRFTATATWTEITAATPASGKEKIVDVIIVNFASAAATIYWAIKTTTPTVDTEANDMEILSKLPAAEGDAGHRWTISSLVIPDGQKLWVKSSQADTRVTCSGNLQTVP